MLNLIYKFILITALLIIFLFSSYKKIYAETVVFRDDFFNGFQKWELGAGDWKMWSIYKGKAQAYVDEVSTIVQLMPKDEYWNDNWKNYQFELDFEPVYGIDRNIAWYVFDKANWYELHFIERYWNLVGFKDGRRVLNLFERYRLNNGKKYRLKIRHFNGQIQVFIDDIQILHVSEELVDHQGKIALRVGTGAYQPTIMRFDNVEVKLITEEKNLNIESFKQTDPAWANEEYDSGSEWSKNPTIERWGCAMTAMAMIMRYYGLDKLPDENQTPLTPAALNNWLKSQKDGYIGSGYINWIAVTRLAKQISDAYSNIHITLPKLKFAWANNDLTKIIDHIKNNRPVILNIPGHFLVADGYTANKEDLYIKDPFYDYQQLSEHNTELLSTRTFTPTQSDLSYLLFIHNPELKIIVLNENGEVLTNQISHIEPIADPLSGTAEINSMMAQTLIAKPDDGKYFIKLMQDNLGDYQLDIYAYDQNAEPSIFQQKGTIGNEPIFITLNYKKDGPSEIEELPNEKNSSWQTFRAALLEMLEQGELEKHYAYRKLDRIASYAEQAVISTYPRYVKRVKNLINWYEDKMTVECKNLLVELLDSILQ